MQVVMHVNAYYEWEPVPDDVTVTQDDIDARRVKPAQNGKWLMKVEKDGPTYSTFNVPEDDLHQTLVNEMARGAKQPMTREQLAHRFVTLHQLHHEAHPSAVQEVEVHDDGPDEAGLRALLDTHVKCKNIRAADVERLVAKYLEPSSADSHVAFFHQAYGVTPERIAAEQTRRKSQTDAHAAAHAAHLTNLADVAAKAAAAKTAAVKGPTP
jgi:hypothetical protein